MGEATEILEAIAAGDSRAAADLLPLVYEELRKLAAARMAVEKPGQTLQATALVHEAYVRLVGHSQGELQGAQFANRAHFFAAAAEAMRRILIENARRKGGEKHGGRMKRLEFEGAQSLGERPSDDLLDLSDALDHLAKEDPVKAELVKLRCFAGLSHQEAAEVLGLSRTTADRYWAYAKSWLYCQLYEADASELI